MSGTEKKVLHQYDAANEAGIAAMSGTNSERKKMSYQYYSDVTAQMYVGQQKFSKVRVLLLNYSDVTDQMQQ